ncbi:hypothetical protein GCM10020331_020660 [Ectobacillus funiculus]
MITIQGIHKQFHGLEVLKGIDLTVEKKEQPLLLSVHLALEKNNITSLPKFIRVTRARKKITLDKQAIEFFQKRPSSNIQLLHLSDNKLEWCFKAITSFHI